MAIKYDIEGISGKLSEIEKAAKELEEVLADIEGDVNKLADNWHGQGKEGWHAAQTKWHGIAQSDVAALNNLIKAADSAVGDMKHTADSVKEQFR